MTYFDYFYQLGFELEKTKQTASNMCDLFKAGKGFLSAHQRKIYLQLADEYYEVLDKHEELLTLFKDRRIKPDDKIDTEVFAMITQ